MCTHNICFMEKVEKYFRNPFISSYAEQTGFVISSKFNAHRLILLSVCLSVCLSVYLELYGSMS